MNSEWHEIALAPDGEIVETKIDDDAGERNNALLIRQGRMWFFPDKSMYVYYTPTHWRRPTPIQLEALAVASEKLAQDHFKKAAEYRAHADALASLLPRNQTRET